MTIAHQAHRERIEAGIGFEWDRIPQRQVAMGDVPADVDVLAFQRKRHSHRGIGRLRHLTTLWAYSVDQSFLDEICEIAWLRVLQCGDFFPAHETRALARAQPRLRCDWFEKYGN